MRVDNWPRKLDDVIRAASERPFSYGDHDCCQFVVAAIEAITGKDTRTSRVTGYRTAQGAAKTVARFGGLTAMIQALCAQHGFAEVPTAMAQRGDVMLIPEPACGFDGMVGIRTTGGVAVAAPAGLTVLPWRRASRAWRIQ